MGWDSEGRAGSSEQGSSRLSQPSVAREKCPDSGFGGLSGGVLEVQDMLGEGPRPPRAHAGRGWAPRLTAPLTPVTWPAPCTTCSCRAKTAVPGPPQSLGASGNACASFRPCPPCLPSPASCGLLLAWGSQSTGGHKDGLLPAGVHVVPGLAGREQEGEGLGN